MAWRSVGKPPAWVTMVVRSGRKPEGGADGLEPHHGGAVAHDHLAGRGADERRDALADRDRQVPPPRVPAADELVVPLLDERRQRSRARCRAPAAPASCRRGRCDEVRPRPSRLGSAPMTDVGGEVRLGTMLFTLVEPHRGHEVAYNRWYERDHFYAGCMVGPWLFAGRRFVATRAAEGSPLRQRARPVRRRRIWVPTWPSTGSSTAGTTSTSTGRCDRCSGCMPTAACSASATTSTRCCTATPSPPARR